MPRRLRIVVYSVLLVLSLYMYWLSGQPPAQVDSVQPAPVVVRDPLQPSGSLNVRREALTTVFENIPHNLAFSFVPLADGRSRVVGRSVDGGTVLELIGPPESVNAASLMASLPEDSPLTRLKNLTAITALVETTLRDWPDGSAWVSNNIDAAFAGSRVRTETNGKVVTMSSVPQTETLVVTVTGPPL